MGLAKAVSAEILEHSVPFCSDFPIREPLPDGLVLGGSGALGIYVGYRFSAPFARTLRLVPRVLRVGIGCRRGISREAVEEAIGKVFAENRLDPAAILGVFSIDLKEHEPGQMCIRDRRKRRPPSFTRRRGQRRRSSAAPSAPCTIPSRPTA